MEVLNEVLKTNLESKESDCRICTKCGEPVEKVTYIPGLNKYIKGPVMCSCRKKELERKCLEEENGERQNRLKRIISNSLMDEKFKSSTFKDWDFKRGNEKMYNIGTKYSNGFLQMKKEGIGLLIYGEPGNGKTHTTACIANALIEKMVPVICVHIDALLNRIKETYNTWGKEVEEDVLKGLANADLLIIDDLGAEQYTDWSRTKIYNIIDSRYRNGLPLIVTTNLPLKKLEDIYEKRTYDRLIEMCTPVKNDGKSIRVEKAKEKTKMLSELLK